MGIRAARAEHLDRLTIVGENAAHATRYEPTPPDVFQDMLLDLPDDLSRFVFVDLGCGKGRVLCLAAARPFARVIGVEFAEELYRVAKQNVAAFSGARRRTRDVAVLLTDAAELRFPDDPLVLFMFNPFRPPVLGRVVENLERSLAGQLRPVYVLYYMPQHAVVLDRSPAFLRHAAGRNWIAWVSGA